MGYEGSWAKGGGADIVGGDSCLIKVSGVGD